MTDLRHILVDRGDPPLGDYRARGDHGAKADSRPNTDERAKDDRATGEETMERPASLNLLLVCHANTARSVMAQALLEKMLAAHDPAGRIRVRSGGIAAYARDGILPSLDARIVLGEEGIHLADGALTSTDLRRHRHLVAEADLILTMTGRQKEEVRALDGADARRIYTLREFAGEEGDIADPATQGEEAFRACRDEIKRCLERSMARLLTTLAAITACKA